MKQIIVTSLYDNKKLSKFLLDTIPNLNFGTFCMLLRKKDIKINGKRINKDCIIHKEDEILVYLPNKSNSVMFKNDIDDVLDIFYEDANIILLNKPQNIEVTGKDSLTDKIHKLYRDSKFKPMPCHRLDRNTSGLILFAKNQEALNILLDKFKNHEIEKHYYAWVYSIPNEKNKKMSAYLFKDNKKCRVYISDIPAKGYQKIITSYKVLKVYATNTCLLDVEIETGKTHQIRAHLSHIGLPIIGDGKYGKNEINKKFHKNWQCLCSYSIGFKFVGDSGILNYLSEKVFSLPIVDFDI